MACRAFSIFFLIGFSFFSANAEPSKAQALFQEGIRLFQEKNYPEASAHFAQAAELSPNNGMILYNWAVSLLQEGRAPAAAGALRKALSTHPDFSAAKRALEYTEKYLKPTPHMGEASLWEIYRSRWLSTLSIHHLLALTLLFLIPGGYLMLKYWGRRKRAFDNETPLPSFPSVGVGISALFVVSLVVTLTKAYSFLETRATVITETAQLRSGPSLDDTALLALSGGTEVIIHRSAGEWAQVSYPGGLSGWVEKSSLFHTSGKAPW